VQASILNLYDPDRAQTVLENGEIRSWSAFLDAAQELASAIKAQNGAGFRILTGTVTSPPWLGNSGNFGAVSPGEMAPVGARFRRWCPGRSETRLWPQPQHRLHAGQSQCHPLARLRFPGQRPGHIAYAKQYARRRKLDGPNDTLNRLYVVEPTPTVTGSSADHRLPLRAGDIELFARALAGKLGLSSPVPLSGEAAKWLEAVAKDLQKERRASLVVAGEYQPAAVHALAHAINASLGNVGTTLYYTEPVEAESTGNLESLRELCADMDAGKVDLLLILGGNPLYDAPHDFDFTSKLKRVPTAIHLSPYYDETSVYCHWHVSESHYLETWSDARAYDGTATIIQPLIAPLYYSRSAHDVVAAFSDKPGLPAYDAVRAYWTEASAHHDSSIDVAWRKWLNDGVVPPRNSPPSRRNSSSAPRAFPCSSRRPRTKSNSSSAPTPTCTTAALPTTAGCRNCPSP